MSNEKDAREWLKSHNLADTALHGHGALPRTLATYAAEQNRTMRLHEHNVLCSALRTYPVGCYGCICEVTVKGQLAKAEADLREMAKALLLMCDAEILSDEEAAVLDAQLIKARELTQS